MTNQSMKFRFLRDLGWPGETEMLKSFKKNHAPGKGMSSLDWLEGR